MLKQLNDYDWQEAFGDGSDCQPRIGLTITLRDNENEHLLEPKPTRKDVDKIFHIEDGERDESDWIGVFLMKDGRYVAVESWCDYTGWD